MCALLKAFLSFSKVIFDILIVFFCVCISGFKTGRMSFKGFFGC